MFDRALLKTNAKNVLSRTYWTGFGVTLLLGILGGGGPSFFSFNSNMRSNGYSHDGTDLFTSLSIILPILISVLTIVCTVGILYGVFISAPLQVGACNYFIKSRKAPTESSVLFSSFKNGRYISVVKTMFMTNLYIFLWSLLLVIPGIIKHYEYYYVPYILAENPKIDTERALEVSRRMTDGHKMDIFVLDLSFLGWLLLAIIPCGLGTFFLSPYMYATYAESYEFLKSVAINSGKCTLRDFGVTPAPVESV